MTLAAAAGLGAGAPPPPFALPADVYAFKSELLAYFSAGADDSEVIGEEGLLGVACLGAASWGQFCVAVKGLCDSPWAATVVAAVAAGGAGAAGGPLATIYTNRSGAAGASGKVMRVFGGHPPGAWFD